MSGSETTSPGREGTPRVDWRLAPLAAAVWAAGWWGTSEREPAASGWCLAVVVAAAVVAWRGLGRWSVVTVIVGCAASGVVGLLAHHQVASGPVADLAHDRAFATVSGTVSGDVMVWQATGIRPALARGRIDLTSVEARGDRWRAGVPLEIVATGELSDSLSALTAGERVELVGLLRTREPGDDVPGVLRLTAPPTVRGPPGWFDAGVNAVRESMRDSMRWATGDEAALVPSLVLGDTTEVSDAVRDDFQASALTHLMAVSGANLALVLVFVGGLLAWVGLRDWGLDAARLLCVGAFVVVCRAEPSVIRAAAMALVTLLVMGRPTVAGRGVRHVCVAVCGVVLLEPWLARSWGFALSVAATTGIVWWGPRWRAVLVRRWPEWMADLIAVPLAAQLATQPLITAISGGVSGVGLLANVLAAPFVGPVTVVGLAGALVNLVPGPLGAALGWLAAQLGSPIVLIARWSASLPGARWPWPSTTAAVLLLAVVCLAVAHLVPRVLARRRSVAVSLVVMAVVAWWTPRPLGWPGPWEVVFCSVGQGDAAVLRAGPGQGVMIDVGPEDGDAAGCLAQVGVRHVPLVILTHFHADHVGGLAQVLRAVDVGQVWVNPLASPVGDASRVRRLAADHGASVVVTPPGRRAVVGDVSLTVVAGGDSTSGVQLDDGESSAENDSSLVITAEVGGLTVLFPGDAEPAGQRRAVAAQAIGRVDVLKMPHHGSARQDPAFWKATGAALAVASSGFENDYGHPARAALTLASTQGMVVARTDLQGSIAVWRDEHLHVRSTAGPG